MGLREELKQFGENAKKEMKQLYEKAKRHPLTCLICIIVIIVALSSLIAIPHLQVAQFGLTNPKDLAEMENSYRATLAQILGGIVVGIGIYFAWGNLTTSREGQITERFTRAVDQLGAVDQSGSPAIEIRLGGIYALERIANESEKDYWPIMEILTAYVRKNSVIKDKNINSEGIEKKSAVTLDVQATLTVIGRCKKYYYNGKSDSLNLRTTYLQKANLEEANLEGAYFEGANLGGADLVGAKLFMAHLVGADLGGANLRWADFEGAFLVGANLKDAQLYKANLTWTKLVGADLRGAELWKADLEGADLTVANLEGAKLEGAYNLTINQLSEVFSLYNAELDDEFLKPLKEKYPALFEEPEQNSFESHRQAFLKDQLR
jgi:uncharacterized protein YjbI with pentapeptide repeats